MIQIRPNLFIGNEQDYEMKIKSQHDWNVVHACKEPYHRNLLGYSGRGAPKAHPEYLIARRENRLFLNLVDADDPNYIPKEIIDSAIAFMDESLLSGQNCLVHCNQGESRSPSLGLLYLAAKERLDSQSKFAYCRIGVSKNLFYLQPKSWN
ncbi:dual specificity protein phosphatase family protein [Leptospira sp. 'Mane']|uniref:dual specificity protein phosphatase family protein n=1 Tax=Leptospira sp. 'Mane' TaxID=3387407 RepID=UPI00398B9E75